MGDLGQWVKFFLTGIIESAERSVNTLSQIMDLKTRIEAENIINMGNRSKRALEFFHSLFSNPMVSVSDVQKTVTLSAKAAGDLVKVFVEQKILVELTTYKRNRVFLFEEYLRMFEDGERVRG